MAGNVKPFGMEAVAANGPYRLHADAAMGELLNELLQGFVAQRRMSLGKEYRPCFEIVSGR